MQEGEYQIIFVATRGSDDGSFSEGRLVLKATSEEDRSPATGEVASDFGPLSENPLYGWVDADLDAVGAPICHDGAEPPPDSRDPVYPGVLVLSVDWEKKYPEGTPVLTVATMSNQRNGTISTDGCGIGLWVHEVTPEGFSGVWREWGIIRNGRGRFCAARVN